MSNLDRVLAYCSTNAEHTLNSIQNKGDVSISLRMKGKGNTAHLFRQSAAEFGQDETLRYRETVACRDSGNKAIPILFE